MTDQVVTQTTPNVFRVVQSDKFGNDSPLLEYSFGHKPFNRIRMVVKTGFEADILLTADVYKRQAHGLIVPLKNAAPVNSEAIRSSAGALTAIPVCRVGSIRNTLKALQAEDVYKRQT